MTVKKQKKPIAVLFLVPSPLGISPGQRFRFEHYLPLLEEKGISYSVRPFLSLKSRNVLYSRGNSFRKGLLLLSGYARRIGDLFRLSRYDYVYIHRWAATAGPPLFEWIIAKIWRKKIVYDFDDAIWVRESAYNKRFLAVKFLGKVAKICSWAHTVTVGNRYLKEFAEKNNKNVILLPTVVNTDTIHNRIQDHQLPRPAVGWTGSFSTLLYLDMIVPVLQKLQDKFDFTFYVIADKDPKLPLKDYRFVKWDKETETYDLLQFHIGLMPLTDDEITRGKCGFKAIQYMALGISAVVSPVGVNMEIVKDKEDGFICGSSEEWETTIAMLLENASLRQRVGLAARKKIEDQYSVTATREQFLEIFQ